MRTGILAFGAAALLALPVPAQETGTVLSESDNFRLLCPNANQCGADATPDIRPAGQRLLDRMEDARAWLEELGFPVVDSHLEFGDGGLYNLRLDTAAPEAGRCGLGAIACSRTGLLGPSQMYFPTGNLDEIDDDPSTLAHEFVHTLQPKNDPGALWWVNEAVAEAVGAMFGVRHGMSTGIYPPVHYMSLDRPFYDVVSTGYGNWAYLIALGQYIGSADAVAYLAQPGFLEASRYLDRASASAGMQPFYDPELVGDATFDDLFPRFVASFNNTEPADKPERSDYHYYTAIQNLTVFIPRTDVPHTQDFEGSAVTYAVAPVLIDLEVIPEPEVDPKDTLMLVEIELTSGDPIDDLSLVLEHRRTTERHKESVMLDGTDAPEELGFLRVLNAPRQPEGQATENAFEVRVRARPIAFESPACFQAGLPATMITEGFEPDEGFNWRLKTDNGTVDGVSITPERAGTMTVVVEIDSPVTRRDGTLQRVEPERTEVELGSFDVLGEPCMVRMTTGPTVMTWNAQGHYTEFSMPGGIGVYYSSSDLAVFERGGWVSVPPIAKTMLLNNMQASNPGMGALMSGVEGDAGVFASRMPLEFSQRFAWTNLRNATGPDGEPAKRSRTPCPSGGSGCAQTTILMGGVPVPVVLDAQGRPLRLTMQGQAIEFAYGVWNIRRPPGW